MNIKRINHIGIATADVESALGFWRDTLGLPLDRIEDVPSHQVRVAFLPAGDSEIELVMPTGEDTYVAAFVQEKGGGLDHLCLEVDDIDAILAKLKAKNVRLINETPVVLPGRKIAFVHPVAANGVLLEFYEITPSR